MASKKGRTAPRSGTTPPRAGTASRVSAPASKQQTAVVVERAGRSSAQPAALALSRPDIRALALLVLCALGLYVWRLDQPKRYVYDEVYHAYTAVQLAAGNADAYLWNTKVPAQDKGVTYEWTHPAFAKLPMQLGVLLFGADSFGWRFASAIFGAIGVGVLYVLGCVLIGRSAALIAAGLLLLDGLWFVQSRTAMNDVFVVVFLMLAYLGFACYLMYGDRRRWRPLWWAGVALGFGLATKWSALYSFGLMSLIAAIREIRRYFGRNDVSLVPAVLHLAGAFLLVPLAIYLCSYVQFFLMGHTFSQWIELQRQMWYYHSHLKATHTWQSRPWSWPLMITPVWYYVDYGEGTVTNVWAMGNPLIWWVFLPAIIFVAIRWRESRYRSFGLGLLLLGFLGQWLPWFFSPRISFLYHMLPSVPFACLAIAYALVELRKQRLLVGAYLAAVVISFIYFYPQYAAWTVSSAYADQHYWLASWQPR